MFSIVIPLYNKELSVGRTIQSVLNQTLSNFEIVIVNDGSTDNSVQVVEQITDSRIRIIHQKNRGVSSARNKGIIESKCEWIVFLDADDLWEENHLEELENMIKLFPDSKVFCTSHNKSDFKAIYKPNIFEGYEIIEDYFSIVMKNVDFFWTGAVCIQKDVFDEVGLFPIGISRGEDLYMWGEIGEKYKIIRSLKVTVKYSFDSENKLTKRKQIYEESIISKVSLRKVEGIKRQYYKRMIFKRLKNSIKSFSIIETLKILINHNVGLFK